MTNLLTCSIADLHSAIINRTYGHIELEAIMEKRWALVPRTLLPEATFPYDPGFERPHLLQGKVL